MNKRIDLTRGSIPKKLLVFYYPILLGTLFQQLYNTVDAIIVGRYVGTGGLAAIGGSAAQITSLIIGFFTGLSSGATVVISQQYGAGNEKAIEKAVHTIIFFALLAGTALTGLIWLLGPGLMAAGKVPPETLADSVLYLRIYFLGAIPLFLFNIGSGILRAVGDSKNPLMFLTVSCVTNILLDLLFIRTFHWGVAGAATATVLAQALATVLVVIVLLRADGPHRFRPGKLSIDPRSLANMLRIGIPAGLNTAMFGISNVTVQTAVNSFGTMSVAAWTACSKFDAVYWTSASSFGVAICAFVGQCYGAGLGERIKDAFRISLKMLCAASIVVSTLLISLAKPGIGIISPDRDVVNLASYMMLFFVPFYILWSFIEVPSSTLRGMGDAVKPTVIVTVGICAVRILWITLVLPHWNTIECVCLTYPISWVPTAIILMVYYIRSSKHRYIPEPVPSRTETEA